jgi:hypothetical protein
MSYLLSISVTCTNSICENTSVDNSFEHVLAPFCRKRVLSRLRQPFFGVIPCSEISKPAEAPDSRKVAGDRWSWTSRRARRGRRRPERAHAAGQPISPSQRARHVRTARLVTKAFVASNASGIARRSRFQCSDRRANEPEPGCRQPRPSAGPPARLRIGSPESVSESEQPLSRVIRRTRPPRHAELRPGVARRRRLRRSSLRSSESLQPLSLEASSVMTRRSRRPARDSQGRGYPPPARRVTVIPAGARPGGPRCGGQRRPPGPLATPGAGGGGR